MQSESTYGTNNEKEIGLVLVLCNEFIALQHGKISPELASHGDQFPLNLD